MWLKTFKAIFKHEFNYARVRWKRFTDIETADSIITLATDW